MSAMGLYALCLVTVTIQMVFGSPAVHPEVLKEGHAILKRFADAEQEYTSHEIADVLHQKESDSFHRISKRDLRSVTEGDKVKRIRLDLSSGSSLHLNLKKRSLFDSDTQYVYHTDRGHVKRETPPQECYATGDVEVDGKSDGTVFVALCDGLHGSATSNGVEYYIHPVETIQGEHKVHVLSRPAIQDEIVSGMGVDELYDSDGIYSRRERDTETVESDETVKSIVIELGIFVDAKYRARLENMVPGREDEYVLMSTAAVQTLYSNTEKVGYDVRIKVKLFMNWLVNPNGYRFQELIGRNLRSFRDYTKGRYKYDIHFLHTGVTKEKSTTVGVAYVGGACSPSRCANMKSIYSSRVSVMAHEIGHTLGFKHHWESKCPDNIRMLGKGFMGGGDYFSPCNKWELRKFVNKASGKCLLKETAITTTGEKYVNLPSVLPGQYESPDEQCRMFAGEGYEFYRPFDLRGVGECAFWACINLNKESPEYLRVVKKDALRGYPCGEEMFCQNSYCLSWEKPSVVWDVKYLREQKRPVTWSDWSQEWSECSSECGPGVQLKRRRCNINNGTFLTPYCRGPSIQARLCNRDPCPGKPGEENEIRQARGNEVCARFHRNNVNLKVDGKGTYLPRSLDIWLRDGSNKYLETKSCMLTCKRNPTDRNHLDGIFPDGTPCTESPKSEYTRQRFGIDLRCVQGVCTELSDCPGNEDKDACGVCGGDPIHCVNKIAGADYDVPVGERSVLAVLPPGTKGIDINMDWVENLKVRFEVFNKAGRKILGTGGLFKGRKFKGKRAAEYAGTKWTYSDNAYVRADGPTDQEMVVKALRHGKPITRIHITYLLPEDEDEVTI